ncbi:MAG: hypothetical protein E4H38_03000 [Gemmatimonadales bacterium]|nr:MAG: hypothetical protein E4H38_03000 [Gemmatimonadales bacterium]
MFRLPSPAAHFSAVTRLLALAGATALALGACSSGGNDPPPAGVPKKVVIITQPTATVANRATLTPAPVVEVRDGRDDPVLQAGISVTAGISSGNAVLTGTLTGTTDAAGRVTFPDLQIQGTVGTKVLQFTSGSLKAALSSGVTLTPGPAAKLVWNPASQLVQAGLINQSVLSKPSVIVTDPEGNGVSGVAVTFAVETGSGTGSGLSQTSAAGGFATVGDWVLGPNVGPNTMSANSNGLNGTPVTFTADGVLVLSQFSIDLVFLVPPTAAQAAAFANAKNRWEQAVTGDLEDFNVGTVSLKSCGVDTNVSGVIDDLKIVVELKPYDGVGNVLGAATPCFLRPNGPNPDTPIIGYMFFDTADLANLEANGSLSDVVLHEMGHVLGFGTIWEGFSFNVIDPGVVGPTGLGYTGGNGLTAFLTVNNGNGTVVPVDATGGEGTERSHWDENLLRSEIMTGFISGIIRPLSATSIASLADIGYQVNLGVANPFDYTNPQTLRAGPQPAPISFGDDIVKGTIMYVEKGTGRTWTVPRR